MISYHNGYAKTSNIGMSDNPRYKYQVSSLLRQSFSRIYLGSTFYEVGDTALLGEGINKLESMPSYPDDGSITVINDIVVIKLSD